MSNELENGRAEPEHFSSAVSLAELDGGRAQKDNDERERAEDAHQESVISLAVDEDDANMQIEAGRALAAGTREILEQARAGRLDIRVARAHELGAAGVLSRRTRRSPAAAAAAAGQQSSKATSRGTHISAHQLDNCYYHARSSPSSGDADESARAQPAAIGAFRTCNGLSGIIHVNNESLVIHPFYSADLNKKQPHIIYRYQQTQKVTANLNRFTNQLGDNYNNLASSSPGGGTVTVGECGNLHAPNEWRQSPRPAAIPAPSQSAALDDRFKRDNHRANVTRPPARRQQPQVAAAAGMLKHLLSKRDVGLTEKYIELGLVLSKDMFTKRNASSRSEVLHDAIQIINCLDLYFRRSTNTRVGLVYIETWAHGDQIELSDDPKFTLYNFLDYTTRHMYGTHKDAVHLITGGHQHQFQGNSFGMSVPDSVCEPKAVSVSQESSVLEPFITAATIAHLIGHNLGMDHDDDNDGEWAAAAAASVAPPAGPIAAQSTTADQASSARATAAAQVGVSLPGGGASLRPPQSARETGGLMVLGAPRHRANQRQHQDQHHPSLSASSDGLTADDHEDEIKSRSLTLEPPAAAAPVATSELSATGSGDQLVNSATTTDTSCRANCIMSERLVFQHPPIALGNMVQHQVPATVGKQQGGGSGAAPQDQVNTYSIQETSALGSGAPDEQANEEPTSNDQQQQQQQQVGESTSISNVAAASLPFRFSRRSIETYYSMLREGGGACLWNLPNKLESSIVATCGNGIVERDEDCDCGTRADCWMDTCCERLTCKFRKDVECISGACCDRCRFRARGFMCRRSRGECDLAEYCDGASGACAPDVHKQNGFPCATVGGPPGYCYMGQCPTHDGQCSELWGAHARASDKQCYAQLNTNGTIFGNCGRPDTPTSGHGGSPQRGGAGGGPKSQSAASYKRCEQADQMCGTLQCQLGDMKPITADLDIETGGGGGRHGTGSAPATKYEFSRKVLRNSGGDLECKMITRPIGGSGGFTGGRGGGQPSPQASPYASSISYVRDGSKCAESRVCFNRTCVALERAYPEPFELCPRDEQGRFCSQHGVCSTANRCHCDASWTGEDCSQSADVQVPAQQRQPTTTLIEITTQQQHSMGAMSQQQQHQPRVHSDFQPVSARTRPAQQQQHQFVQTNGSGAQAPIAAPPPQPPATTTTSFAAQELPTTTTEATGPAVQPPQPTQAPVSTTTTVQDKKKNESLGAQTLVLILVSIVAAVYLGFALMANCYRRKGLLKPDKVLRHHQMNCKMDALRSSFIARRLADAETMNFDGSLAASNGPHGGIGGGGGGGAGPGNQWAPLLSHNASGTSADLMSPFVSPIPAINLQHQFVPPGPQAPPGVQEFPHHSQQPPVVVGTPSGQQQLNDESARIHMTASSILNHPHKRPPGGGGGGGAHAKTPAQQQVRYFDPSEQMLVGAGSGDHIPLLGNAAAPSSHPHRMLHQPMMRSFNQVQQTIADRRRAHHSGRRPLYQAAPPPPPQSTWTMRSSDLKEANDATGGGRRDDAGWTRAANLGAFMNRTTSLGSVHKHHQAQPDEREPTEDEDASLLDQMDQERRLAAQGALATPSRSLRDKRAAARARASSIGYQMGAAAAGRGPRAHHLHAHSREFVPQPTTPVGVVDFDSCSAPSSPEHRGAGARGLASYWTSGGRREDADWPPDADELGAFVRPSRPRHSLKQQRSFERQTSPADSGSPPPPPPPLPPVAHNADHQLPLGAPDAGEHEHEHHLSLIGQLQQLEKVQSLHAQQVAAATNNTGGLHEFFSLPLSVQLSALLARSLAESSQLSPVTTHIDEFLNTLNNTSVAASSRRSFKAPTTPGSVLSTKHSIVAATVFDQSGSSSRGGTMRKQQQQQQNVKLQSLSSLISRLQKLQHKTLMQQQQRQELDDGADESNEDEPDLNEDELAGPQPAHAHAHTHQHSGGQQSRHSTLGRPSRSGSRATNQIAAEVHRPANQPGGPVRRSDSQRTRDDSGELPPGQTGRRPSSAASKNELVYSMSDSEDGGAYETRHAMLTRPKRGVAGARTRQTGGGGGGGASMELHEDRRSSMSPGPKDETPRSSLADNSSPAPSLSTEAASSRAQNSRASPNSPAQQRTPGKEN